MVFASAFENDQWVFIEKEQVYYFNGDIREGKPLISKITNSEQFKHYTLQYGYKIIYVDEEKKLFIGKIV